MVRFKRNVRAKRKDRTPYRRFSLGWLFYKWVRYEYWKNQLGYLICGLFLMVLAGFVMYRYITWFLGWE